MVYWLALATTVPAVTLVCLWLARGPNGLRFDWLVLIWLISVFSGFVGGLLWYDTLSNNPLPVILGAGAVPFLILIRLTYYEAPGRCDQDEAWAMGLIAIVAVSALLLGGFGVWLFDRAGSAALLSCALIVVNALLVLVAVRMSWQVYASRRSTSD